MDLTQAEPVVVDILSRCVSECLDCRRACTEAAVQVLSDGAERPRALVSQLWDCADMCETNAGLMLRGSALIQRTCETCAEICEACATQCDPFVDDVRLQASAQACRRCAATCRDAADVHRSRTPPMVIS
jgi:hypothetical protein